MDQETVYGTHEDNHVVMSEKVQSLAGSIYQEFERMIARYDEDVVKELMPLLVNVLECLDIAYTENQEHEVELELLREDNEQLVTQYEREKQLRKASDQKLLELEDVAEDERKELLSKIDSLESILKMLELKTKNSHDHGTIENSTSSYCPHSAHSYIIRLEEKEAELKREYSRLHDRYTELFKTHVDYMERTKMLVGSSERLENTTNNRGPNRLPGLNLAHMSRSSGPLSYGFQSLEGSMNAEDIQEESPTQGASLKSEIQDSSSEAVIETSEKSQLTDNLPQENKIKNNSARTFVDESPETDVPPPTITTPTTPVADKQISTPSGRSRTEREQRSGNTLYQELSFQDADALGEMDEGADITVNDNFFGMGKEVENLIMENNELLATKNALNIVKDDLIVKVDELTSEQEILRDEVRAHQQARERMRQRVSALEEELKKVKEEAEAAAKATKSDDEEDVPLAQRKRFTRVEMARVLMERNQYKERFMELQEAVRWTEMIRASKTDPASISGGKQSVWKFFSNLFTGPADRGSLHRNPHALPHIRYSAPTNQVVPAPPLDAMRRRTLKNRHEIFDQGDTISSEKRVARLANERKEQYRQVRAHVRKEDGRLQAYGWSLPGKPSAPARQPVPVPVYCRPLQETESGMKIWCGAGVNLSGGKTRDGGLAVGGSVFYADEAKETVVVKGEVEDAVEHLDKELQESEQRRLEAEQQDQQLSSLVWICTSTQKMSKVSVIDANNPADILQVFNVCQSHLLCIASVPGAKESDYIHNTEDSSPRIVNGISETELGNVQRANHNSDQSIAGEATTSNETKNCQKIEDSNDQSQATSEGPSSLEEKPSDSSVKITDIDHSSNTEPQSLEIADSESALIGKIYFVQSNIDNTSTRREIDSDEPKASDDNDATIEKISSIQPTMWLGAQNGAIYVHSAVAKWSICLHTVMLKDAVLGIVHIQGRVLVALADGTVAIFRRGSDGQWDLSKYHVMTLGSPQHAIRCMTSVSGKTVWCGYRNKIHVIDPILMTLECTIDAHPRRESQVRQLAWLGEGVWVSIRLDSTLRLYHAHTYQHLQDVDIEPYVSKMLGTGKLGFSFVRITALLISSNRLWIGTGNGVIISVPLSESAGGSLTVSRVQSVGSKSDAPGVGVRVFASDQGVTPGSSVPYCSMAHAQLSFHGHRDAVKMFVAVPGHGGQSAISDGTQPAMLVLSGGEGYIDFRVGDGDETEEGLERTNVSATSHEEHSEQSHLIVWQVQSPIQIKG
ncbi:JNK-interacting protein 3 isoform X3 [Microplitis demolitor]|uniref:JNK-interacting protein 3 isoform X3 n=1 Tax=Microplitis demolitor TaxID=69319 RepID=UPI0006D52859|nr:JNK-interacting protein 3 isoform X3 [Microplitis demolitor]